MENLELIKTIISISSPAAITLMLWKSGLLSALASRLKKNGGADSSAESDKRLLELEEFRLKAETNHFHDLENLHKELTELKEKFGEYQVKMENRLARLEVKIFNGHK